MKTIFFQWNKPFFVKGIFFPEKDNVSLYILVTVNFVLQHELSFSDRKPCDIKYPLEQAIYLAKSQFWFLR